MPATNHGNDTSELIDRQTEPDSEMADLLRQYDDGGPGAGENQPGSQGGGDDGDHGTADPGSQKPGQTTDHSATKDGGDEGGEQTLQEQLSDLASTYGVPATELEGFSSAEDAENALRTLVEQQAQMGRAYAQMNQQYPQQGMPGMPQQPYGADAQFQQPPYQQPGTPQPTQGQQQQPGSFTPPQIDLSQLEEDHPLTKTIKAQNEYLSQVHQHFQQMQQAQQQAQEQAQQRELQIMMQQVNETLEHLSTDRYGTLSQSNVFQQNRRQRATQFAEDLAHAYMVRGQQVPPMQQLLTLADRTLFHQEIEQERLKNRATARQSRNGARLGRPSAAPPSQNLQHDPDKPFEEQPELIRMYYEMEQQAG